MHRRARWFLLTFITFGALAHDAAPPKPLREELLQLTQAWVDAMPTGDKPVGQNLLTDDAVLVDEFGRITHKADSIAALQPFPPGFSGSIQLRNPTVRQYGNTAIMQVEEYERETVFGQSFTVRYQSLLTFVKQAGGWKLAAYEDVTLPTPPPKLAVSNLVPGDYVGTYRYAPNRAWTVSVKDHQLGYLTHAGGATNVLEPIAKDVFMGSDDERNLLIFHRDAQGKVDALIERRKFNDLHLSRDAGK